MQGSPLSGPVDGSNQQEVELRADAVWGSKDRRRQQLVEVIGLGGIELGDIYAGEPCTGARWRAHVGGTGATGVAAAASGSQPVDPGRFAVRFRVGNLGSIAPRSSYLGSRGTTKSQKLRETKSDDCDCYEQVNRNIKAGGLMHACDPKALLVLYEADQIRYAGTDFAYRF